jgi:hypothetical protein
MKDFTFFYTLNREGSVSVLAVDAAAAEKIARQVIATGDFNAEKKPHFIHCATEDVKLRVEESPELFTAWILANGGYWNDKATVKVIGSNKTG